MGFLGKVKRGVNKIGKGIRAGGRAIGKVVTSKKFKTGLKVAAGIALAAGAVFAGHKAHQKYKTAREGAQEVLDDVAAVRSTVKQIKRGVKEGKSRASAAGAVISEAANPGVTRAAMEQVQKSSGATLADLTQVARAPEAKGVIENIGAMVGIGDKKTSGQKTSASKAKQVLLKEVKERKAALIAAEEGGVVPNVVNAIIGHKPTIPKEKPLGEVDETSFFGRISGFFAPEVDFEEYGV